MAPAFLVPFETSGETLEQGGEQHGTSFEDRGCGERKIYRSEQTQKSSSMALLFPQSAHSGTLHPREIKQHPG
jgi:hypothetical protein